MSVLYSLWRAWNQKSTLLLNKYEVYGFCTLEYEFFFKEMSWLLLSWSFIHSWQSNIWRLYLFISKRLCISYGYAIFSTFCWYIFCTNHTTTLCMYIACACTHSCTHAHTHAHTHTYTHTYTHTNTHTHKHTHTNIHTHTHTAICNSC